MGIPGKKSWPHPWLQLLTEVESCINLGCPRRGQGDLLMGSTSSAQRESESLGYEQGLTLRPSQGIESRVSIWAPPVTLGKATQVHREGTGIFCLCTAGGQGSKPCSQEPFQGSRPRPPLCHPSVAGTCSLTLLTPQAAFETAPEA